MLTLYANAMPPDTVAKLTTFSTELEISPEGRCLLLRPNIATIKEDDDWFFALAHVGIYTGCEQKFVPFKCTHEHSDSIFCEDCRYDTLNTRVYNCTDPSFAVKAGVVLGPVAHVSVWLIQTNETKRDTWKAQNQHELCKILLPPSAVTHVNAIKARKHAIVFDTHDFFTFLYKFNSHNKYTRTTEMYTVYVIPESVSSVLFSRHVGGGIQDAFMIYIKRMHKEKKTHPRTPETIKRTRPISPNAPQRPKRKNTTIKTCNSADEVQFPMPLDITCTDNNSIAIINYDYINGIADYTVPTREPSPDFI